MLRPVYYPDTSLPLSKPRFVSDGEGLRVVNRPTAGRVAIARALANPWASPLLEHEQWLDARYASRFWHRSVLASLAESALGGRGEVSAYELTPEMGEIGARVIDRFVAETEAARARPILVHLPRREELQTIGEGRPLWYGAWLAEVEERHEVVRPELLDPRLTEAAVAPGGHYSPGMNRAVARALHERLAEPVPPPTSG